MNPSTLTFLSDVDSITAHDGATVSGEFTAARDGLRILRELADETQATRDALAEAVTTGDPASIRAAIAAHTTAQAWRVDFSTLNDVEKDTLAGLRVAYRDTAAQNYAAVAEAFNAAVDELNKAVRAVDVNAPAERVISASAKERTAWEFAPSLASRVDGLAFTLASAARLAGANLAHTSHERVSDQPLALVLSDTTAETIRAVWAAWDNDSHRAGRWGALAATGHLGHARPLEELTAYRRAKGYATEYVPAGYGARPVKVDLETGQRFGLDGAELEPLGV
jgi:hypothetical protein